MTCSRSGITGAPLCGAAEVTVHDQTVILFLLVDVDAFTLDEIAILTAAHSCPRHAKVSQLANGDRRFLGKDSCDLLIRAPVRTFDGVEVVQRGIVTICFYAVSERRLHSALGCTAVAASRWHKRQDKHLMPGSCSFYRAAFSGQATTNNEYIGINDLCAHVAAPARRNASGGDNTFARTSNTTTPRPRKNHNKRCSRTRAVLRDRKVPAPHLIASR